jgi:hypothetical protein
VTSKKPSPSEIQQASDTLAAVQKADALRPGWDDLLSEGVIDHIPEPGADGEPETTVHGHDKVVRLLQMQEQANLLDGERGEELQARIRRIPMRDRHGRIRMVAEEREDHSALKHGARRLVAVRYGKPKRVARYPILPGRIPFPWESGL